MEFQSQKLRCPCCNREFMVEVPTGVVPLGFDTDFRPVFGRHDPIAAELHACPSCRYAGYAGAFEREAGEDDEERDRRGLPAPVEPLAIPDEDDLDDLRRWIRRGALVEEAGLGGREPSPAERYLLAARCREYLGQDAHLALHDLYLRGAWCARAAEEPELERKLLVEAGTHLSAALEAGSVADADKGRLTYLAGELARRAGDFARAVDLLGQVDAAVDADEEEGQRLLRLARRQESLAVVKSAVNARLPEDEDDGPGRLPLLGAPRRDEDEDGDES